MKWSVGTNCNKFKPFTLNLDVETAKEAFMLEAVLCMSPEDFKRILTRQMDCNDKPMIMSNDVEEFHSLLWQLSDVIENQRKNK